MGIADTLRTFFLGSREISSRVSSVGTIPIKEETIERVPLEELEKIYIRDEIVFNGINLYEQIISSTEYKFECSNDSDLDYMLMWDRTVNLREVISRIVINMCIYGRAWNDIVYNDRKTDIVRLYTLDPKYMDFSRDMSGKVIYDKLTRKPKYYVQIIPFESEKFENEIMHCGQRAIKINTDALMYTPFYTVGDSIAGIGLIEPMYDLCKIKRNIQIGSGLSIYHMGSPKVAAYVGSDKILPNPPADIINNIAEQLSTLNTKSILVLPHYVKLDILESKKIDRYETYLNQFIKQQVSGLGVPAPFVTGHAEETPRAALDTQLMVFNKRVKTIQKKISESLETQVFNKISQLNDFKSVPKLVWEDTQLELIPEKLKSIIKRAKLEGQI